ncbi:MAG: HAMP domain-containing histidine kinase [Peptococcaceae bacterium]|jgi:signal transduction histidine kinase|nr:HAMP domain-containing histidine kinase [Peptococcaceae bacterium]
MKKLYAYLKNEYFRESLELRVQSFNLLALAGIAAGVAAALSSIWTNAGAGNVISNFAASALAFVLLRLTGHGKKLSYRVSCWMIAAGVFMLLFPYMFFTAGAYRSGMPCFFVFALIFTAIMLEGKGERSAALFLEFLIYAACCFIAYFYPETVTPFPTEFDYVRDVIMGITVSSALLTAVVLLHIRMYRVRQTQIGELNRELEARNETLTRYDRMKSDFLAAVAHEIKTPLDVIVAGSRDTVDLLDEAPVDTAEIISNQEKIAQRAMRIDAIMMDLMDTAAIENGRLSLSRRLIRLSGFLEEVCGAAFKKSDARHNRLVCDFQPDLPPLWADPARIEQVMANLISNAVRHTRNGVITVKLARTGKTQVVSVTDDGEGMDAAVRETALRQYVSSHNRAEYWRHGIGLYLCRQIVTAHGGEIWIESEPGRGAAVAFSLGEESEQ